MHFMKRLFLLLAGLGCMFLTQCRQADSGSFTAEELAIIHQNDSLMRVLTIADSLDNAVLRDTSIDLSAHALLSEDFATLQNMMIATVTHPSQDGVGIAGPQVGLSRRVVAVQRFDKEGEPFEVYPNIRIIWTSDSLAYGPEGCLSVPDRRGEVLRSQEIVIEYADVSALRMSGETQRSDTDEFQRSVTSETQRSEGGIRWNEKGIPMKKDTIKGFTAVIFQHETDHLDGILYIDRL